MGAADSPPLLLVGSCGARDTAGVVADAREAPAAVDLIEVRLDRFERPLEVDLAALARDIGRPAILTLRPRAEGGEFDGEVADRAARLREADGAGFAWIDLEADVAGLVPRGSARRVVSWHSDDTGDPGAPGDTVDGEDVTARVAALAALDADVVKIATTASDAATAFEFVDHATTAGRTHGVPVTAIAMGPYGRYLRPLAGHFSMPLLYAALRGSRKTAAGQTTVAECLDLHRAKEVTPRTRVFAVAGGDVLRSLSPHVHEAVFRALDRDAVYVDLSTPAFAEVATVARRLPLAGLSVTAPFKRDALEFADEADETATAIGAANTLVRRDDGRFVATNTDGAGFIAGIEAAERDPAGALDVCVGRSFQLLLSLNGDSVRLPGRRHVHSAVVFGTGGAARAIVHALRARDVRVHVTGRSESSVVAFVVTLGGGIEGISPGRAASQRFDLLVKAVPDDPSDELPLDPFDFARVGYAADVVYSPLDAPFLHASRRAGRTPVPGVLMFAEQAVRQAIRFADAEPTEVRPAIVHALAREFRVTPPS